MKYRNVWPILFSVCFWFFSVSQAPSIEQDGLIFLTSQEAKQLQLTEEEWQQPIADLDSTQRQGELFYSSSATGEKGPEIIVQIPAVEKQTAGPTIETSTPTDLMVLFNKRPAPVDMESLHVIAKKGIFSKTLTDRLKPYIQGTSIIAKRIKFPEGRFLIQISIADLKGMKTTETYRLKVIGKQ
jgi:hypothetical protein